VRIKNKRVVKDEGRTRIEVGQTERGQDEERHEMRLDVISFKGNYRRVARVMQFSRGR